MIIALTIRLFLVREATLYKRERTIQARSSGGERHPDAVDVQGSNPCVPTICWQSCLPDEEGFVFFVNKVWSVSMIFFGASLHSAGALS